MRVITHPIPFDLFLIAWNRAHRQTTPDVHLKIARWLQERWKNGDKRLLLMAFRSCGKSTITGVFAAWLLYANPDLRILVIAAEGSLAQKMVRNVRRIIEKHPLTAHLKPSNADQWAGERFTVNRRMELRDPSVLARGIDANITGSRADVIICDDVEVPKTSESAEKRENLRERLHELEFILTAGGTMLYVGTPHSWYTIYADAVRAEIGEIDVFLKGYERLEVPVMDRNGQSAWAERYSVADIEQLRLRTGVNKFQSQMMLVPTNIMDGRLNPALLKRYSDDLEYTKQFDVLEIDGRKMVTCTAFWDPAVGGGDGSVVAVIFTDETGHLWLHRVCYVNRGSNVDEGQMQCHQVATIMQQLHVPSITIETNGVGATLPGLLRTEMTQRKIPCRAVGRHTTENKNKKILAAFLTVMEAGMLHVHETVYNTPFIREMQEWTPQKKTMRDDGLDAVASALALRPPVIKTEAFGGRLTWHGKGQYEADTGFEVL